MKDCKGQRGSVSTCVREARKISSFEVAGVEAQERTKGNFIHK